MTSEERKENAVGYHGKGYNCCQSVLCSCKDLTGMEEAQSASMGYGFAGGMYCGEVCGAVTGGLMAIGACISGETPQEKRPVALAAAKDFQTRFKGQFDSILCREILAENGKRICDSCIAFGTETAAAVIEKLKEGEYQK